MGEAFRCEIKKYRILSGLTQEELALATGVTRQTIISLEGGHYNTTILQGHKLAQVLDSRNEKNHMFAAT